MTRLSARDDLRLDTRLDDERLVVVEHRASVGAFLIGLGLGAAAALLLAPGSGEDTRRQLSRRAQDAGGAARRRAQDLVAAGRVAATQARQDLERRITETRAAYQAGQAAQGQGAQGAPTPDRGPAAPPAPSPAAVPAPAPVAPRAGVVPGGYEAFDDDGLEG